MFIALMGAILLGGTNHVSVKKFSELAIKNEITNGYQVLKQGQMIYREHTDSYLPIVDWKVSFQKYAFLPQDIQELTWEYNKNGVGYYFCLTGNVSDPILYKSLVSSGKKMGQGAHYINENCGSSTNFTLTPNFSTPTKVSTTFFIK
jgi:hypothetical protein